MDNSLKAKTVSALSWSFVETVLRQSTQFIFGIILARLLTPAEFGLIGMVTIFIAISQTLINSGFGAALVQKKHTTQVDICSIFYFNIVFGFIVTVLLYFAAPIIARFYQQPVLIPLTRLLSLVIVINSFGMIQETIVTKELNFKIISKVSIFAGICSGTVGVIMAAKGFGVWSLAVQQITNSLLKTGLIWFFNSWRPNICFSFSSLKEMFGFGSRILASGVLNQVFNNIYYVVIGKIFTPSDLGYFTRAKTLQDLPTQTLSNMVGRVTFPVFSRIQDDKVNVKKGMKKALTMLSFINFPLMIGIAAVAPTMVIVLFTQKWAPSIIYLQLLCFSGLLFPLQLMNLNILQALGRSDLFFKLEIIKKTIIVINIFITFRFGIIALIIGMMISSLISYYVNSYYTAKLIHYSIFEQVGDLVVYLGVALVMGGAVYGLSFIPIHNNIITLSVQVICGILLYFSLCRLFNLSAFTEVLDMMVKRFKIFSKRSARYNV